MNQIQVLVGTDRMSCMENFGRKLGLLEVMAAEGREHPDTLALVPWYILVLRPVSDSRYKGF